MDASVESDKELDEELDVEELLDVLKEEVPEADGLETDEEIPAASASYVKENRQVAAKMMAKHLIEWFALFFMRTLLFKTLSIRVCL